MRWRVAAGRILSDEDHTLVMGVLNVTPDSFSDGGHHAAAPDAIRHGLAMHAAGADIVDVGGESTRPGAEPVSADEETSRVLEVVAALNSEGVVVSVDTSKAIVAEAALTAGASIVNDVSALADPDMPAVVAGTGAGLVLMHMRGEPRTMQDDPTYEDVVEDVAASLEASVAQATGAGIAAEVIVLDPGIGFGKTLPHNLELLSSGVERLRRSGRPVLVGASRKSFLTGILGPIAVEERDAASSAAHVLAIAAGASIIRSHNVVMALQTARVADAIVRGS